MKDLILLIIIGGPFFAWIIYTIYYYCTNAKKLWIESDFVFQMECNKCGQQFTATGRDLWHKLERRVSVGTTEMVGPAVVTVEKTKSLSKKIMCPYCNKKHYCKVNNINDFYRGNIEPSKRIVMGVLVRLGGAAVVMMFLAGISSFIENIAK